MITPGIVHLACLDEQQKYEALEKRHVTQCAGKNSL
jgi:hypothetical protein